MDSLGRIRTGKVMLYDAKTGHRIKEPRGYVSWAHAEMKLPDFQLKQCFFGEHLLSVNPSSKVMIVESEKTAIIEVMSRGQLHHYQNTYGEAMKAFGLERGIVGSTAKHVVNSDYYKQRILELETNIEVLEKEQEAAREGRSKLLSLFGKGELSDAKKELSKKDAEIASLKKRIEELRNEKSALCQQHKQDIAKLRNGYKAEIDKAIREQERLQKTVNERDVRIAQQDKRIDELDRKANPQRYRLSSDADNYNQVKEDVKQIVKDELGRIANDENLKHLIQKA